MSELVDFWKRVLELPDEEFSKLDRRELEGRLDALTEAEVEELREWRLSRMQHAEPPAELCNTGEVNATCCNRQAWLRRFH